MIRYGGITQRLMTYLLGGAGAILLLIVVTDYFSSRSIFVRLNEARGLYLARSSARQIDDAFVTLENVARGLTSEIQSRQALAGDHWQEMADLVLQAHDSIYGIMLTGAPQPGPNPQIPVTYRYRAQGRFMTAVQPNVRTEEWYYLATELKRPVWTSPYDGGAGYALMISYAVPYYTTVNGQPTLQGVIKIDVSLDWINQLLQNLPLGAGDYGFLISPDGTYIAHPIKDFVMNETIFSVAEERHDANLRRIGQRMQRGEKGIIQFASDFTKKPTWLSFSPIPSTHWSVAINLSQGQMLADLKDLSQRKLFMGIGWMSLLLLVLLFVARSITRPLKRLEVSAKTLATGALDSHIPGTDGHDEIATLARTFDKMRTDLKQYMEELSQTVARKERIESELRIAHDIQMSLVPKSFPAFPQRHDMDLFASMDPAFDVGGDFYDFFLVDESRLFMVIGDVSGKGVPAALHMAVTRSMLRSTFHGQITLSDAISRVNNELSQNNDSCMFVTLFSAVMHLDSGRMEYVNAGHNLPVLIDAQGNIEVLCGQHGPAPGMIDGIDYGSDECQLSPGQTLFLYTDGVTEAMNPQKELFGEMAMQDLLKHTQGQSCEEMVQKVRQSLREFAQGAGQSDDITMMVLRWLGQATVQGEECRLD